MRLGDSGHLLVRGHGGLEKPERGQHPGHRAAAGRDGDILLLHDCYPTSVTAALEIVDRLQPRGVRFVTVEELFAVKGVQPACGTLYRRVRGE